MPGPPTREDDAVETAASHSSQPPEEDTVSAPTLAFSANRHRESLREQSDKDLLFALRDHEDEAALDELIRRKTGPLIHLAARIVSDREEARDIVQMTFVRLWEHRDRFDERWSPNTWIYRICSNLSIDHLRSRRSKQQKTEPVRLHLRDLASAGHQRDLAELHSREVDGIFHELAAGLTEKQRAVFLLRELEELPSKEVAEIVGCQESTVRNHLFNARKLLRAALLERYPEYARHHEEDAR